VSVKTYEHIQHTLLPLGLTARKADSMTQQETQLSQLGRAMLSVVENFDNLLQCMRLVLMTVSERIVNSDRSVRLKNGVTLKSRLEVI